MKKNWFQILSLALNVALLITLLVTRAELVDTRTILKSNLDGIAYRLSDMDDRITNLSAKQREQTESLSDFSLEPTGLDPKSHTLQAGMSITLRRWTADTEVALAVTQNGRTTEQPMSGNGGVFTACLLYTSWCWTSPQRALTRQAGKTLWPTSGTTTATREKPLFW